MNWINYDRLVSYLNDLIVTSPQQFNYSNGWDVSTTEGGCVDCHCRVLMGTPGRPHTFIASDQDEMHGAAIQRFLSITPEEANALWSPGLPPMFGGIEHLGRKGADGIREALRRLAILAARYERPATSTTDRTAIEAAFLNSLRTLAADPVSPV